MAQERQFFVRSDNITKHGSNYMGTKLIWASSGQELLKKACIAYELPWPPVPGEFSIYLWSGPIGMLNRVRLDSLDEIPSHISDVWLRYTA
jgi:hypothetical protein